MRCSTILLLSLLLPAACLAGPVAHADDPALSDVRPAGEAVYEDRGEAVYLGNGRIELLLLKQTASIRSLKFDGREMLGPSRNEDKGEGYIQAYPIGGYRSPHPDRVDVRDGDGVIDVGFIQDNDQMPFPMEVHYVVRDGVSGFYGYIVLRYDHQHFLDYVAAHNARTDRPERRIAPDAQAYMEQLNFCLFMDDQLFTIEQVDDDRRRRLRSKRQEGATRVMDATFREPDGRIYTKYDLLYMNEGHRVHGVMGHTFGAWVMQGSGEHLNGGPTAQELSTEHAILLQHFNGAHLGSGILKFSPEEDGWAKLAGPFFFYFNRGLDEGEMWWDARKVAQDFADAAPHPWMSHELYPHERGAVEGRLRITDGTDPAGALVILAQPPGEHHPEWQRQGKGFIFWARVRDDGSFRIPKVRPNTYSLYVLHDDQFGEHRFDSVAVAPGETTDVGAVVWEPEVVGRVVWRIGRPDRDAGEFALGRGRSWGRWRAYHRFFPDGIDFRIGKSDASRDWCALHTVALDDEGEAYAPDWRIRFDMPEAPAGRAALRLGIAAVRGERPESGGPATCGVEILVNGEKAGEADYVEDGAPTRSATRGWYRESLFPFDASRLRQGENTITLRLKPVHVRMTESRFGIVPSGILMYDAVQLELDEDASVADRGR